MAYGGPPEGVYSRVAVSRGSTSTSITTANRTAHRTQAAAKAWRLMCHAGFAHGWCGMQRRCAGRPPWSGPSLAGQSLQVLGHTDGQDVGLHGTTGLAQLRGALGQADRLGAHGAALGFGHGWLIWRGVVMHLRMRASSEVCLMGRVGDAVAGPERGRAAPRPPCLLSSASRPVPCCLYRANRARGASHVRAVPAAAPSAGGSSTGPLVSWSGQCGR